MRVGYLINRYPAISHTFIAREIAALESRGGQVARFSLRPGEVIDARSAEELSRTRVILDVGLLRLSGVALVLCCSRPLRALGALRTALRLSWNARGGLLRHLAYLLEACQLVEWMDRAGIQHLHAHFGTNPAAVALLARSLGGPPFSFTVHGPEEFDRPVALSLSGKVRGAAFVVAISEFCRSQILRWIDSSHWDRVKIVRCGLDERFLSGPLPAEESHRLVCVGRLSEQKGHLVLIDAVDRVRQRGVDVELVLVGDGPLREKISSVIRERGIQDVVSLLGALSPDDVRKELASARAFVLASFAEGIPVGIMEALALGRPVVTTYVGGIPELVENGVSGLLVPAGAVEPLSEALTTILDAARETLEQMGRAGFRKVSQLHDARIEAEKLAGLFEDAATEG